MTPHDSAAATAAAATVPRLSISIVVFRSPPDVLAATLASVVAAARQACDRGVLREVALTVVDNAGDDLVGVEETVGRGAAGLPGPTPRILRGHGNVGYGRGHNLSVTRSDADYHLVLNPDVIVDREAFVAAVTFLREHPDVGLLSPQVRGADGTIEYLCKRYPSVLALALRGFAPASVRRLFRRRLEQYEMRDAIGGEVVFDPPIVSGCFMFLRHGGRAPAGGFAKHYFLYFEDFDYSLRVGRETRLAYVPQVRITHFGGRTARKGLLHTRLFVRSALTFFREHGWRWT